MLTRKQLDLLTFIHNRLQKDQVSPSFDEMKEALNLRSKSGIHRLITALEERGFIRRLAHRARAIEILKMPEGMEQPRPVSNVIEHDFSRKQSPVELVANVDAGAVPLMGRIAAGTPIEAIANPVDQIAAPSSMLSSAAEHFALEVKGDSMIDAGIHEGDIVVVRSQDRADDGDIVVALVRNQEATLKTLRRASGQVELHAANPAHRTQRYHADEVKIQGKMVGLIRTY